MRTILALLLVSSLASAGNTAAKHASKDPAVRAAQSEIDTAKAHMKAAKAARKQARKARVSRFAEILDSEGDDFPDVEDVCTRLARPGETWEDACRRVTAPNATDEVKQDAANAEAEKEY
jgi:hypothetical protein